nr:MAG TPA: hypothetical protein [Caudoviricetes sp.]
MSTTTAMPTTGTPRTPSASARISQPHYILRASSRVRLWERRGHPSSGISW